MKKDETTFSKRLRTVLRSVREYKRKSFFAIFLIFLETGFECTMPLIMSFLLNSLNDYNNSVFYDSSEAKHLLLLTIIKYSSILIGLAIVSLICGILAARMSASASCGFAKNLRHDLFEKTTSFSFSNIDNFSSSSLITRQTIDVSIAQQSFQMMIRITIRAPIMSIFSFVMFIIVSPALVWVFLITIPLIATPLIFISIYASKRFLILFDKYDAMNEKIEENVRGMRAVKMFVKEKYEEEKMNKESSDMKKGFVVVEQLLSSTHPMIQCVLYLSMLLLLFLGTSLVIKQGSIASDGTIIYGLNIGDVSSMITYSARVLSSLMMISMVLFMLLLSIPSVNRIYEVLVEKPSITNTDNPIFEVQDGSIEFKNVSFKYSKNDKDFALKNINLNIKSGMTVGIIGATGSSKSTLVNMISRFYDVTQGEVLVSHHNVKEYDLQALRNSVSMVLQKNFLFKGTVKDNLRWGNKNASEEEIIEASKIAQCHEFVNAHKEGYERQIEQGGSNVSGGQRQRLCIARALLKKPKILVLDDSTSAVDTKTDALIRQGLKNYLPGTTKIIIAQRISSICDADTILVMDKGEIINIGTHDYLLKNSVIYKDVFETQNRLTGVQSDEE